MADHEFRAKIGKHADQWTAIIAIFSSFLLDVDELSDFRAAEWGPEEQAFMARLNIRLLELEASEAAEVAALDERDEEGEQQ
jgi:hypothetical protein